VDSIGWDWVTWLLMTAWLVYLLVRLSFLEGRIETISRYLGDTMRRVQELEKRR
jgi:hypothetical protein